MTSCLSPAPAARSVRSTLVSDGVFCNLAARRRRATGCIVAFSRRSTGNVGRPDRLAAHHDEVPMSVFSNRTSDASEHAGRYVTAVLQLLGDADPIDVLRGTPRKLAAALDAIPAAAVPV